MLIPTLISCLRTLVPTQKLMIILIYSTRLASLSVLKLLHECTTQKHVFIKHSNYRELFSAMVQSTIIDHFVIIAGNGHRLDSDLPNDTYIGVRVSRDLVGERFGC